MQSVSSRNWTHVAVSISYDDNHYTTGNIQSELTRKKIQKYLVVLIIFNFKTTFTYLLHVRLKLKIVFHLLL